MGSKPSVMGVEGACHGENFDNGVTAAKEGRYCVSEVCFQQALNAHPARAFWAAVNEGISEDTTTTIVTGDTNAPTRDSATAHLTTNDKGKLELPLSFDEEAGKVADYVRLCMDIALVYVKLPIDERNVAIGMSYCAYTHLIVQKMLFLQAMWLRESRDAFLKSKVEEALDEATAGVDLRRTNQDEAADDNSKGANKWHEGFFDSKSATRQDILAEFMKLMEMMRFFFATSGIYFALVLMRTCNQMDHVKEMRKVKKVLRNCTDILSRLHYDASFTVDLQPESSLKAVVKKYLPPIDYHISSKPVEDGDTDGTKSKEHGTVKGSNGLSCGVEKVTAAQLGGQGFLYQAKFPNLTMKITMDFTTDAPMRLKVAGDTRHHKLCRLQCGAQRDSFRLITWYFADHVSLVSGFSHVLLARELPYYSTYCEKNGMHVGVPGKCSSGLSIAAKGETNSMNIPFASGKTKASQKNKNVTAAEREERYLLASGKVKKVKGKMLNRGLDLTDRKTVQLVDFEEALVLQCSGMILLAQLVTRDGDVDRQQALHTFAEKVTEALYGFGSEEYKFFHVLCGLSVLHF